MIPGTKPGAAGRSSAAGRPQSVPEGLKPLGDELGTLFPRLVRHATRLPVPLAKEGVRVGLARSEAIRYDLIARGDCPDADRTWRGGMPEAFAAETARPGAGGDHVRAVYEESAAKPRILAALCTQLPPTRGPDHVAAIVDVCLQVGAHRSLARLVNHDQLTGEERLLVALALDSQMVARGAAASSDWLPDVSRDLKTWARRDVAFGRALFARVRSAALIGSVTPATLPDDPALQLDICRRLLEAAHTEGSPPPNGLGSGAASATLLDVLPSTTAQVAVRVRDQLLHQVRWPMALSMRDLAAVVRHAGPLTPESAADVRWFHATSYTDPYGHVAGPVADYLTDRLGDSAHLWQLLGRHSSTFTGTVGELADVVCGIASTPEHTTS